MKYIFYVHSHITFYCSLNVIKFLNLKYENCIFFCARNYHNPNYPFISFYDISELHERYSSDLSKAEIRENLMIADKLVDRLTESMPFILVTSTLSHSLKEIISTHKKCRGVEFIEEGISSYMLEPRFYVQNKNEIPWWQHTWLYIVKPIFGYKQRTHGNGAFNSDLYNNNHYFGFYEDIFPFIDRDRIVINGELPIEKILEDYILNDTSIFVFDAVLVEQKKVLSENQFIDYFGDLLDKHFNNKELMHVKFHPSQSPRMRKLIEEKASDKGIRVKVIPDEVALEQILIQAKNTKIYGIFSTLLFYAHKFGHDVTSFKGDFEHLDPIADLLSKYPPQFP